jgi:2'-phosphotransferase
MDTIKISKTLSYLLRHGAKKEGIIIRKDGYCKVSDILKYVNNQGINLSINIIKQIVSENSKQRFSLINESGVYWIRANQGHSNSMNVTVEMIEIKDCKEIPIVIHGTNLKAWSLIVKEGLSCMSRQHIHFASGMFGETDVISGMRKNCDIFIYINTVKAMNDGIVFYKSSNGVILTSGKNRILSNIYFKKVTNTLGIEIYKPQISKQEQDENKIKNLERKINQIQELKEKQNNGITLELNQIKRS